MKKTLRVMLITLAIILGSYSLGHFIKSKLLLTEVEAYNIVIKNLDDLEDAVMSNVKEPYGDDAVKLYEGGAADYMLDDLEGVRKDMINSISKEFFEDYSKSFFVSYMYSYDMRYLKYMDLMTNFRIDKQSLKSFEVSFTMPLDEENDVVGPAFHNSLSYVKEDGKWKLDKVTGQDVLEKPLNLTFSEVREAYTHLIGREAYIYFLDRFEYQNDEYIVFYLAEDLHIISSSTGSINSDMIPIYKEICRPISKDKN